MYKILDRSHIENNVKTGRIESACHRYGVGRSTMRKIAERAGAVIRVGRVYLIDFDVVDKFLNGLAGE